MAGWGVETPGYYYAFVVLQAGVELITCQRLSAAATGAIQGGSARPH